MFYNSTNERGLELEIARDSTKKQDARVLAVFSAYPASTLSPWLVKEAMDTEAPITSIRRAINTLTRDGRIMKTKVKVMGPYGRPCYCWRLSDDSRVRIQST